MVDFPHLPSSMTQDFLECLTRLFAHIIRDYCEQAYGRLSTNEKSLKIMD